MPFRGLKLPFPFRRHADRARWTSPAVGGEAWRDWLPTLRQWVVWLRQRLTLDIVYILGLVLVFLLAAYLILTG